MTYPFVAAKWFSAGAIIEVRALVIHFAEGGGTVQYFKDPRHSDGTPEDVSAHFVLQYDGTIVQMVRDEDADHCQHIDTGSWAYPGGLTRANGVAVLGLDVMGSTDHTRVNRYVQAIELEGHRDQGPNAAQAAALPKWVDERRAKFPTIRGLLGHGDIQNKACPGALIPWSLLGGHGVWEADVVPAAITDEAPKVVTTKAASNWYDLDGKTVLSTGHPALPARPSPYGVGTKRAIYATVNGLRRLVLVTPATVADPPVANCADAVAAEHERTRNAAIKAVEGI